MLLDEPQTVPAYAVQDIIHAGNRMDQRGWVPATAGNISLRVDDGLIAITSSGTHKGYLTKDSVILVNGAGMPLAEGARPSAETALHCQIYQQVPHAGAVLHGHSVAATVLSMHEPGNGLLIGGYEVLKAFEGQRSHDTSIVLPIFDNDQDIPRLASQIAPHFKAGMPLGYVIRGHGVYMWGLDMPTALARLEGLEFLLACELERRKLGARA